MSRPDGAACRASQCLVGGCSRRWLPSISGLVSRSSLFRSAQPSLRRYGSGVRTTSERQEGVPHEGYGGARAAGLWRREVSTHCSSVVWSPRAKPSPSHVGPGTVHVHVRLRLAPGPASGPGDLHDLRHGEPNYHESYTIPRKERAKRGRSPCVSVDIHWPTLIEGGLLQRAIENAGHGPRSSWSTTAYNHLHAHSALVGIGGV